MKTLGNIYEKQSEPQEITVKSDQESLVPMQLHFNENFQSGNEEPDNTETYI